MGGNRAYAVAVMPPLRQQSQLLRVVRDLEYPDALRELGETSQSRGD